MNKLRNIIHLLYIQLLEEFIKKILFRKVILMKYVCNDSKQLNLIPNKIRSCFKNIVINYYNNYLYKCSLRKFNSIRSNMYISKLIYKIKVKIYARKRIHKYYIDKIKALKLSYKRFMLVYNTNKIDYYNNIIFIRNKINLLNQYIKKFSNKVDQKYLKKYINHKYKNPNERFINTYYKDCSLHSYILLRPNILWELKNNNHFIYKDEFTGYYIINYQVYLYVKNKIYNLVKEHIFDNNLIY